MKGSNVRPVPMPLARRCALAMMLGAAPVAQAQVDTQAGSHDSTPASALAPIAEVLVVGTTPMPGSGIDIDKVPSNVQTMSARDLDRPGSGKVLPSAIADRMGSVSLNNEQGNPYQPDFVYRGFAASPISGVSQGLAVYQGGTRINEAFGDSVNWDLVPMFAVDRMTVQGNNPVFGLNALGGAVTLDMKDGFKTKGSELWASTGSWRQRAAYAGSALRSGAFGFYAGVGGFGDDGFRDRSRTTLRQVYADAGYEQGPARVHLSFTGADNSIGAVGPTPIEMLADDRRSVFTYPQTMHNEMALLQLRGSVTLSPINSVSAETYYRRYSQRLVDGNTTDAEVCENDDTWFCFGGEAEYPDDALYDSNGNQVPTSVIADGATPGEIDRTRTTTDGAGVSAQWTLTAPLFGRSNHFVAGASYDRGSTAYRANGEIGTLADDLEVIGAGVVIDQGQSATASPPIVSPVAVRAVNVYTGVYFTNTLDLTPQLAWTLSGRYNRADISLRDRRAHAEVQLHRRPELRCRSPGRHVRNRPRLQLQRRLLLRYAEHQQTAELCLAQRPHQLSVRAIERAAVGVWPQPHGRGLLHQPLRDRLRDQLAVCVAAHFRCDLELELQIMMCTTVVAA